MNNLTISNLIHGGGYAKGATTITANKPLTDMNIDKVDASFSTKIRKQIKWLNVNGTEIPTMVSAATTRCIGVTVNTQVESDVESFNREAENLIERHKELGVGELTGKYHANQFYRAVSDFDMLEGGVIVRHHYNTAWAIPYKYELVSVGMIDVSKSQYTFDKERKETTLNGLVKNKWGQITHIWLYTTEDKVKSEKIKYDNITYYSEVWVSIGQQVAISKLTSMLSTLDQVSQYGTATLQQAIEAAKAGKYLKSQAYNEVMKLVSNEINKIATTKKDVIGEAVDLVTPILKDLAKLAVGTTGTTPIALDDEIQFDTSKIDSEYNNLNSNSEMKMSSSQGMSAVGVFKDASKVNYSAIKYVMESDGLSANIRFDNISNHILKEIHKRLIQVGIQIGEIKNRAAFFKNPTKFLKFSYLRLQMKRI